MSEFFTGQSNIATGYSDSYVDFCIRCQERCCVQSSNSFIHDSPPSGQRLSGRQMVQAVDQDGFYALLPNILNLFTPPSGMIVIFT